MGPSTRSRRTARNSQVTAADGALTVEFVGRAVFSVSLLCHPPRLAQPAGPPAAERVGHGLLLEGSPSCVTRAEPPEPSDPELPAARTRWRPRRHVFAA